MTSFSHFHTNGDNCHTNNDADDNYISTFQEEKSAKMCPIFIPKVAIVTLISTLITMSTIPKIHFLCSPYLIVIYTLCSFHCI